MIIKSPNATHQPAENTETSDRWVKGVLDLIKLTNQGKLTWKRVTDPSLWEDEYEAALGQKRIKLEILSRREMTSGGYSLISGYEKPRPKPKSRSYPYLRIYKSIGNELAASFPDIAPIGALTDAVSKQIAEGENGILQEIHAQLGAEKMDA